MIQLVFFILLIITLLAGVFSYFPQQQKPVNPLKLAMDSTGLTQEDNTNVKKTEQIDMVTNNGLINIRRKIDNLALVQQHFKDSLAEQERILRETNLGANNALLGALNANDRNQQDVLQLKALATSINDDDRLLVSRGQNIISLNDQVTANRQLIAEQVDLATVNTASSLNSLEQQYNSLQSKADALFDQINKYNQQINENLDKWHQLSSNMPNTESVQLELNKERMQEIIDKENEAMQKVAESNARNQEVMQEIRDKIDYSRQQEKDAIQHTQELISEERQRESDMMAARAQH